MKMKDPRQPLKAAVRKSPRLCHLTSRERAFAVELESLACISQVDGIFERV